MVAWCSSGRQILSFSSLSLITFGRDSSLQTILVPQVANPSEKRYSPLQLSPTRLKSPESLISLSAAISVLYLSSVFVLSGQSGVPV